MSGAGLPSRHEGARYRGPLRVRLRDGRAAPSSPYTHEEAGVDLAVEARRRHQAFQTTQQRVSRGAHRHHHRARRTRRPPRALARLCRQHGRQNVEHLWSRAVAINRKWRQDRGARTPHSYLRTAAIGCIRLRRSQHGKEGVDRPLRQRRYRRPKGRPLRFGSTMRFTPTKPADLDAQTEAVAEPGDAPVMQPSYSGIEKPCKCRAFP
jgi:hypothetical protein